MNNADLAEIRALLQASTPAERRSRRPWLGAIRSLLSTAPPPARPSTPPRRVGLRPAEPEQAHAVEDLLLNQPIEVDETAVAKEARRRAFGQRQELAPDMVPILRLSGPEPPRVAQPVAEDAIISAILRRRGLALAAAAAPPEETPYHPEDLSDHIEGDAEHLYAEAGLFEPHPAPSRASIPEADPQGQLLRHLERVFIAEQAALTPP